MSLTAGTRLGPYEVVSAIGAGGMGEVYKARDTRLDRTVAIKILPDVLAADPLFRERFDREARTISQLEHPHICPLYDVGEHGGTPYLAMQYLEGETLEARLTKGALPMADALAIAIQVAGALDRAHRAGVVHRDLKPGNIFLVRRGGAAGPPDAKLLDFGLAKTSGAIATANLSMLPTTPPAAITAAGTLLGTFQYMAPEQIEGQEADSRTDIFAFGVVLYEMLTGRKAFTGKTQASVIGAILKDEPPSVSSVQALTPPLLDHVVQRCLAKDPEERWQTTADLMRELRWVAARPLSGASAAAPGAAPAAAHGAGAAVWAVASVIAIAAAAGGWVAATALRGQPAGPTAVRFTVSPPNDTLFGPGSTVAVSPDGRRIAMLADRAGSNSIWVRSLDLVEARRLEGTEGAASPFWSPDSRTIGFFAQGRLKTVDADGGPVRTLGEAPSGANGGTWSADGEIVFSAFDLFRVAATGGTPAILTHADRAKGEQHRFPAILPDGRRVLYHVLPANEVWVASLDGDAPVRLITSDSQAIYAAGHLLFAQQGTLMAQRFDPARAQISGAAVPMVEQVAVAGNGSSVFSISERSLIYRTGGVAGTMTQLSWADRNGRSLGTIGVPGRYRNPVLSPDETRVAVEAFDPVTRTNDVWVIDIARGAATRFTFDAADDTMPVWSPDGVWLMFRSTRGGQPGLYRKRSNGTGAEQEIIRPVGNLWDWTPDGRAVIAATAASNITVIPVDEPRTPAPFEPSRFNRLIAHVSPDGRWLLYNSIESGRWEVYVQTFPDGTGGRWQVSTAGGLRPGWSADGREVLYVEPDGRLMSVPVKGRDALEAGIPVPPFNPRTLLGGSGGGGFWRQYDTTRDGRFLLNVPLDPTSSPLTVVVNWAAGLGN